MIKRALIGIFLITTFVGWSGSTDAAWNPSLELDLNAMVERQDFTGLLKRLRMLPESDDQSVVTWIEQEAMAGRLVAPILIEAAKRAFRRNRIEGFKWFYAGMLWGNYDGRRCTDKTAGQAILAFQTWVPELIKRQKDYPWEARKGAGNAVLWEEDYPALASPRWICAHGIGGVAGKSEAKWLRPQSEWPVLRSQARAWLRKGIVELSKRDYEMRHLRNVDQSTLKRRPASGKMRTPSGYAMWDSGLMARHMEPKWVDDETLFIVGYDGDVPKTRADYRKLDIPWSLRSKPLSATIEWARLPENQERFRAYLWSPGEQPQLYSDDKWGGGAFVKDGNIQMNSRCIHVDEKCSNRYYATFGAPGEEQDIVWEPGKELPKDLHATGFRTSYYDFNRVVDPSMQQKDWTLLRKGHGRIVWGRYRPTERYAQARLYPEGKKEPILLAFGVRDIGISLASRWVPFKGAYLFGLTLISNEKYNERWRASNCRAVWWLWPDGRSKKECIPAGPWVELGGLVILPTKSGWALNVQRPLKERRSSDYDGKPEAVYLVRNKGHEVVLTGGFGIGDVSPNGCRMAFAFRPTGVMASPPKLTQRETFRIIDLCDRETGND